MAELTNIGDALLRRCVRLPHRLLTMSGNFPGIISGRMAETGISKMIPARWTTILQNTHASRVAKCLSLSHTESFRHSGQLPLPAGACQI